MIWNQFGGFQSGLDIIKAWHMFNGAIPETWRRDIITIATWVSAQQTLKREEDKAK